MLKPIPTETVEHRPQTSKKISIRKNKAETLNKRKAIELKEEKNILKTVAYQLGEYVANAKAYSEKEVKSLIHGLQRSVLCLQKQRRRSVHEKKRREDKK